MLFIIITIICGGAGTGIVQSLVQTTTDVKLIVERDTHRLDGIGTGRGRLWRLSFEYISQKPLIGWGIGGTDGLMLSKSNAAGSDNEFLTIALYFGIPTMLIYLAGIMSVFFIDLINNFRLNKYNIIGISTAFAYLVAGFFTNMQPTVTPLLFVFLGMGLVSGRKVSVTNAVE